MPSCQQIGRISQLKWPSGCQEDLSAAAAWPVSVFCPCYKSPEDLSILSCTVLNSPLARFSHFSGIYSKRKSLWCHKNKCLHIHFSYCVIHMTVSSFTSFLYSNSSGYLSYWITAIGRHTASSSATVSCFAFINAVMQKTRELNVQ